MARISANRSPLSAHTSSSILSCSHLYPRLCLALPGCPGWQMFEPTSGEQFSVHSSWLLPFYPGEYCPCSGRVIALSLAWGTPFQCSLPIHCHSPGNQGTSAITALERNQPAPSDGRCLGLYP